MFDYGVALACSHARRRRSKIDARLANTFERGAIGVPYSCTPRLMPACMHAGAFSSQTKSWYQRTTWWRSVPVHASSVGAGIEVGQSMHYMNQHGRDECTLCEKSEHAVENDMKHTKHTTSESAHRDAARRSIVHAAWAPYIYVRHSSACNALRERGKQAENLLLILDGIHGTTLNV